VLWDFGDTLVDERWMRRPPLSCPNWEAVWVEVMAEVADRWNIAEVSKREVFAALAARSGLSVEDIEAHAIECCRTLSFHPSAWAIACERRWPQAIVTVNPDLFEDYIVPVYFLRTVFNAIVTSCQEGTVDKVRLCELALDRLGYDGNRDDALLIDNSLDLVQAWQQTGGRGYWFETDEKFAGDVTSRGVP
jgi:FMN phosphatase YigB (HAD superfamily)